MKESWQHTRPQGDELTCICDYVYSGPNVLSGVSNVLVFFRRAIMTHASVPEEDRVLLKISDSLVRLSVGLEDTEDLIGDVDQALRAAVSIASGRSLVAT